MKRLTGREAVEMALALDTAAWFVLPGVWVETFDPLGNRVIRPDEKRGEPCHRPYDGRLDAHLKYAWLDLFRVGIRGQRLRDILDMPDGMLPVRTLEGIDESGYSVRVTTEEYQAGQEKWRELVSHTTGKLPRREYAPGEYIQLELSGFYIDVPEQPQKGIPAAPAVSPKKGKKHGNISAKDAAAALTGVSERKIYYWEKGESNRPPDYPGRKDALAFQTFAARWNQRKKNEKVARNMNRATAVGASIDLATKDAWRDDDED